ncbi:pheromone A receptor-domain-containing protein [Mycena sanguinolenta]|nr:pheromone A receptor-domain-containing protein [Mycena sanguinolenta]
MWGENEDEFKLSATKSKQRDNGALSFSPAHRCGQAPPPDIRGPHVFRALDISYGGACVLLGARFLRIRYHSIDYVVQGHRFDIIEQCDCRPTAYPSIFAIMLISALGAGALVFAALALQRFLARRLALPTHLSSESSPSDLTPFRYIRLILVSSLRMVWALTTTAYNLILTPRYATFRPYTSWADVHNGLSRIAPFPTIFTPAEMEGMYHAAWWVTPLSPFTLLTIFPRKKTFERYYCVVSLYFRGIPFQLTKTPIFDDIHPDGLSHLLPSFLIPYDTPGLHAHSPRTSNRSIF